MTLTVKQYKNQYKYSNILTLITPTGSDRLPISRANYRVKKKSRSFSVVKFMKLNSQAFFIHMFIFLQIFFTPKNRGLFEKTCFDKVCEEKCISSIFKKIIYGF